jgi:Zn-dependent protease
VRRADGYVGTVADRTGLGAPAERDDPGALRVGSIAGIDVMVRSSWLLVAALIAYLVAPGVERVAPGLGALKYVAGFAFAVLLTLSLLLHEISHALMARRYGIGVRSITLHFIGGVTAIDGEPSTPRQEFTISAVGPVTSLAIGGLALALLQVTPAGLLSFVVGGLAGANLVVGVLNLVPGMPLDGGRVLRAAVWKATGNPYKATAAAGWAGRGVAVLVLASPVLLRGLGFGVTVLDYAIAVVFGWFLWSAATSAIVSARLRARLPALRARTLARRALSVPEDLPLAEAIRRARSAEAGSLVTVDPQGHPVGVVNEAAVLATPEERRPWVAVGAVARTLRPGLTLSADLAGEDLVRALQAAPATEYLLVEADGSVYGVLSTADVDAAFEATA